ncbi:MAG: precorrin-6B C5,15-methyltransferase / cobalt-precorrin-6B C5,C15-methyltransferase [Acidimicrobiaceae bacterium]|nr:precorrin-6B C5,15-methyltransferase / cobalt-precorrin-6B C5,C15-methyltransferase [Acidimicrobiaceae bacterium]
MASRILVVGLPLQAPLPPVALLVGGTRQLEIVAAGPEIPTVTIAGDLTAVLAAIAAEPGAVAILASGDPGFFGIVRSLAARFGPEALEVHPAPSSVSVAFARLGIPWDDALVVSAHGRPLAQAAAAVATATKAAVLMSPDNPPEALGKELLALGAAPAEIQICSRLGLPGESVTSTDLDGLAKHTWDPLSVVVVLRGDPVAPAAQLTWGRPEGAFAHRGGMITKAEVRSVALARLDLPDAGVLWDVGAGSGSVAIEAALLAPGLQVFAVERRPDDARRIETNARSLRAAVTVIDSPAPAALAGLPDPDRVFVGGGGLEVLDAVLARLRPGGAVVATFAALDRAAAAAERLGHVVQVAVSRGERLRAGGWRLAAENPVFVAWGPRS